MVTAARSVGEQTAVQFMSRDIVTVSPDVRLRDAARRLAAAGIRGAPVVDEVGCCVGVLSVSDIARWAANLPPPSADRSRTCSYWEYRRNVAGEQVAVCKLDVGACALQRPRFGPDCDLPNICSHPYGACVGEWQVLEAVDRSQATVREYMTPDPVTAPADTPIRTLAQMMIDASVHRVIVVDDAGRPVGIVSSTDVLAAVARGSVDIRGQNEQRDFNEPDIYCGG